MSSHPGTVKGHVTKSREENVFSVSAKGKEGWRWTLDSL